MALLDKGPDMSERGGVETLADVIASVIAEDGRSQSAVARAIGENQQTVNDWTLGGHRPNGTKRTTPSLDDIKKLEDALGLWRGTILRRAGYVDDPQTTRDFIEADPILSRHQKTNLLDSYDAAVKRRR